MRAVLTFVLLLLAIAGADARTVTDSARRKVEVPDRIERVFAAGPPASILLYMLAPEKMTGWPDPPRPEERTYIAPQYRDLPALGRLTGRGGTANLEVVLKVKPDLIPEYTRRHEQVWPEMLHVWHIQTASLPQAHDALQRAGEFLIGHLEK